MRHLLDPSLSPYYHLMNSNDQSPESAAGSNLLSVLLGTDHATQKRFISLLDLNTALLLRSVCRLGPTLVDPLLSWPLKLVVEDVSGYSDNWNDAVLQALRTVFRWPACTQLTLIAQVHRAAHCLSFLATPFQTAAALGTILPHITNFQLHVIAQRHPPSLELPASFTPALPLPAQPALFQPTYALLTSLATLLPNLHTLGLIGNLWDDLNPHGQSSPTHQPSTALLFSSPSTGTHTTNHTIHAAHIANPTSSNPAPHNLTHRPLAALAPLRSLRCLHLPAYWCSDEATLIASGLLDGAPSPTHMVLRAGSPDRNLTQRTRLSWPGTVLGALPGLHDLTLMGGCCRPVELIGSREHWVRRWQLRLEQGGQAWPLGSFSSGSYSAQQQGQQIPVPLRRLMLVWHMVFLPGTMMNVERLVWEAETGSPGTTGGSHLQLVAPLTLSQVVCVLSEFNKGAAATAAEVEKYGATAAVMPPADRSDRFAGGSAGALTVVPLPGTWHLRSVSLSHLLVNRAPKEAEWRVLGSFAASAGCVLSLENLSVTYPEAGTGRGGGPRVEGGRRSGTGNGREDGEVDAGGAAGERCLLRRLLAMCEAPGIVRLELRVPIDDVGVLEGALAELKALPEGLRPAGEVKVEVLEMPGGEEGVGLGCVCVDVGKRRVMEVVEAFDRLQTGFRVAVCDAWNQRW